MSNYICLRNLQLGRGQQVCLAYSTCRKTPTGNTLHFEDHVTQLTFTYVPENGIFQPIISWKKKANISPLCLHLQKLSNKLSRDALIYNSLTYNIQSYFTL